ncbi:hypothetical protein NXH76_13730 [Blautia schinkii]|nr:hypothetical protein [Blautia schinkii]
MAKTNRTTTARRNTNTARVNKGMYVEGNTARRLQELPERRNYRQQPPARRNRAVQQQTREAAVRSRQVSKEARKNREKAMGMSPGFVVFLAVISVAILFCCINYLQLKSQITGKMKNVATLESELTQLREDNDAYYSQVTSNVDLRSIKKIAIGRLGMKYPTDEQTITYSTEGGSYVRQYQDVPDVKSR